MKTSELTGDALDWAVAKCEGVKLNEGNTLSNDCDVYSPSTDWSQGGPIIERERIGVVTSPDDANVWIGSIFEPDWKFNQTGHTPLTAAMRCFVASKLGAEVDVPDELGG